MKRIFALLILFMLLVTSVPIVSVLATDSSMNENTIVLKFSFKKPKANTVSIEGQQYTHISIDGLSNSEEIGYPSLPKRVAKILLPPKSNVRSIDVIKGGKGTISNINNIELSPIEYLPIGYDEAVSFVDNDIIFDEANSQVTKYEVKFGGYSPSVYDKKSIYPKETVVNLGVQYKLGFPILFVDINPVQYDPSTNSVTYYTDITLKVNINKDESIQTNELFRGASRDYSTIANFIDNPSMLNSWKNYDVSISSEESSEVGNLLIITTEELKNYKGENSLHKLAQVHRERDGVEVYIETVENIYSKYEATDMPSEEIYSPGCTNWWERNPKNYQIRKCIIDYYKNKNVDFVLLVGDDNREWEDNWVLPFFGGPLVRTSNDIEDPNEVPTWQLYLYTLELWMIPVREVCNVVCDNSSPSQHIYGPVKPKKIEEKIEGSLKVDSSSNIVISCEDCERQSTISFDSISKEYSIPSLTSLANDVDNSLNSILPIKRYTPCKNCEPAQKSNFTSKKNNNFSNCKTVCVYILGEPKLFYRGDHTTASDLPYSCLDNTNVDFIVEDNSQAKRYPRYFGDLLSEVYVGRAPVDSVEELQNFVRKTVKYIEASDDIYNRMLMVSEYLGFGGIVEYADSMLDELIEKCSNHGYTTIGIPSSTFAIEKLYESKLKWTGNNLIEKIQSGYSNLVNHIGHANVDFNMKLGTPGYNEHGAVSALSFRNNYRYPIFYSQGCFAGAFDSGPIINRTLKYSDGRQMYGDCIAEYLTVKNPYGGVAWIGNSHFGWGRFGSTDGPSQRYHREFIDAIFGEGKSMIGMANQDSKEDNLNYIPTSDCTGIMLWLYYCINVIGDPMLKVKGAPFTPYKITNSANDVKEGSDEGSGGRRERNLTNGYLVNEKVKELLRKLIEIFLKNVRSTKT